MTKQNNLELLGFLMIVTFFVTLMVTTVAHMATSPIPLFRSVEARGFLVSLSLAVSLGSYFPWERAMRPRPVHLIIDLQRKRRR